MAKYYKRVHQGLKIEPKPVSWLRNIFRCYPYFAGDNVKFKVKFIKTETFNKNYWLLTDAIYESLPGRSPKLLECASLMGSWEEKTIQIESKYEISREGEVEYRMGFRDHGFSEGIPFFSAKAYNKEGKFLVIAFELMFKTIMNWIKSNWLN